jgi:hypothetical protein
MATRSDQQTGNPSRQAELRRLIEEGALSDTPPVADQLDDEFAKVSQSSDPK